MAYGDEGDNSVYRVYTRERDDEMTAVTEKAEMSAVEQEALLRCAYATTRTATFNLNVNRYDAKDGSPLGTFNKQQQGVAPADVAAFRQEGSAIARAMEVGAEQGLSNIYPALPIQDLGDKRQAPKKERGGNRNMVLGFGAAMAALFLSTR